MDTEDVTYYSPGDPGFEQINGYTVLHHEFDVNKNCFVLRFDKTITSTFWKFGDVGLAGGVASGRNITSFTLPNKVQEINDSAFLYCINLTEVNIPDGVTLIGSRAFDYCSLTSLTIPDSV
jgi:hypothetical protein